MQVSDVDLALTYPGQGAYSPGLLPALEAAHPDVVRPVLDRVHTVWSAHTGEGIDDVRRDRDADIDTLAGRSLGLSQLAIFATSVATSLVLTSRTRRRAVHVGHSFGEIAALTAAGAWSVEDGARVVAARVRALGEAGGSGGGMVALSGDTDRAEALVRAVDARGLAVAGHNGPGQVVVSGPVSSLERLEQVAAVLGVTVVRLSSPFAFHTAALQPAAEAFAAAVREIPRQPLRAPVYSPILGRWYSDDDELADLLARHLTEPFDFGAAVRHLHGAGIRTFVECGGRSALTAAVRRTLRSEAGSNGGPATWVALASDSESRGTLTEVLQHLATGAEAGAEAGTGAGPQAGADAAAEDRLVERIRALLRQDAEAAVARILAEQGTGVPERETAPPLRLLPPTAPAAQPAPVAPAPVAVAPGAPAPGAPAPVAPAPVAPAAVLVAAAHTEPTATPTPDARPGSAPTVAGGRQQVLAELAQMYAEALEYPLEVMEEDVELEGDLGVDSVKQTELLARAAARYGLRARPNDLVIGDYPTLGRIADLVTRAA